MAPTSSNGPYVEFDRVVLIPYKRVCDNLATAPDAPKYLTLGDGTTTTTFPTQLSGKHGMSFDGGDYIDTGIVDPFERTDRFSLFALTSSTTFGDVICTYDQNQSYKGFGFQVTALTTLSSYIINNTTNNWISRNSVENMKRANSFAMTYNGSSSASGLNFYINTILNCTTANDTLSLTIKNGKPLLLGARHNAASKTIFLIGNLHFAAIFPFELTPQQVQYLDKLVRNRLNKA